MNGAGKCHPSTMKFAGALAGDGPPAHVQGEVVHCTFPLAGTEVRCECTLKGQQDRVEVITEDGHVYETALPCRASRIYSLGTGVLVERALFVEELPSLQSPSRLFFRPDGRMPKDVQSACQRESGLPRAPVPCPANRPSPPRPLPL